MTQDELVALVDSTDLDSQDLATLFDIPHEDNRSVAKVIEIVLASGDDPKIMAQEIRLAGWLVIGAAKD